MAELKIVFGSLHHFILLALQLHDGDIKLVVLQRILELSQQEVPEGYVDTHQRFKKLISNIENPIQLEILVFLGQSLQHLHSLLELPLHHKNNCLRKHLYSLKDLGVHL